LLGPSIVFFSPPFCTAYAFNAWRHSKAQAVACVALAFAVIELLALVMLMVIGAVVTVIG
jgi:hypothetical protein